MYVVGKILISSFMKLQWKGWVRLILLHNPALGEFDMYGKTSQDAH
jgi:hypothetical protein